jgi:sulfur-carrier protein
MPREHSAKSTPRNLAQGRATTCTVRLASPLRSYTAGAATLAAHGSNLAEVLSFLDERFPGIRFRMIDEQDRIRPHMRLFVNSSEACTLSAKVTEGDTVHVICALSGG